MKHFMITKKQNSLTKRNNTSTAVWGQRFRFGEPPEHESPNNVPLKTTACRKKKRKNKKHTRRNELKKKNSVLMKKKKKIPIPVQRIWGNGLRFGKRPWGSIVITRCLISEANCHFEKKREKKK
jgi:hypothetical protein